VAEPLLTLDAVTAGYRSQIVLRDLSLKVERATIVAIIGPNGHGKSTVLRTVSGLTRQVAGEIRFCGNSINALGVDRRAALGICHVPQGDLLFPEMSVRDNLLMGCYLPAAAVHSDETLERVYGLLPKLKERDRQAASSLSGGERRMLALGRGLMMQAPLMLVDEPSLGLAPIVIEQIYDLLKTLKAQGQTILMAEETPERIAGIAGEVHLLDSGRFVWEGSPDELLHDDSVVATYLGG
jgi:branched-chain amino acid transport system ATP-binding protein